MSDDQIAKWKTAIASRARARRNQPRRRVDASTRTAQYRPGMARISAVADTATASAHGGRGDGNGP
jgi:hypothetical protein